MATVAAASHTCRASASRRLLQAAPLALSKPSCVSAPFRCCPSPGSSLCRRSLPPVACAVPSLTGAAQTHKFPGNPYRQGADRRPGPVAAGADFPAAYGDEEEAARRAQATRRVERVARYFRRLGFFGFWGQLACTIVAAVILAFSVIMKGTATSDVTTVLAFGGIVTGFVSVFWHFGYMRLSDRLKLAADDPNKAPPRANVVANLRDGIIINLLGLGATLLGLQATVGVLVAKALTSTSPMYGAIGTPPGYNPVLALDVFLVQASGNTALSHFIGLVLSLELLRSVTFTPPPPTNIIPKPTARTA